MLGKDLENPYNRGGYRSNRTAVPRRCHS